MPADPSWYAEAQAMRSQGATVAEIMLHFGRSRTGVYRALRPDLDRTPERVAAKAAGNRAATAKAQAAFEAGRDADPGIPGLIPVWSRRIEIVDFARVDIERWEELRGLNLVVRARRYAACRYNGQEWYLHHIVLGRRLTRADKFQTDHINRDPMDNRRANLRIVTAVENCANRGGFYDSAAA